MVFPHTSFSPVYASVLSPFFPAISKMSEDQGAEIENEKERMKERRGKKRKEEGEKKLEKNFPRMQMMGIFSAHWKGPIRLSPQLPWPCSGSTSLFRLVCSPSDSKHCMEMIHIAVTSDLGHDRSSLNLFGDQEKNFFL